MADTNPKPFVFVLMPFSEEFTDIYELGIKAACNDAGAYCERVDEQIFIGSILERVYNQIAKADIIISEMTGRNPNVFYETGYAHALNKQVILLTQNANDIPFDLKHYPHIVYEGKISKLKQQLGVRVHWSVENIKQSLSYAELNIDISINDYLLGSKPTIPVSLKEDKTGYIASGENEFYFDIRMDLHNNGMKTIRKPFEFGFLIPEEIRPYDNISSGFMKWRKYRMTDGDIWSASAHISVFPDCWERKEAKLIWKYGRENECKEATLRVFTELGPKDYPFILEGKKE